MRRSLPVLSLTALTLFAGCDEHGVEGPVTPDQQELFDFDFRSGATPTIPNYPGDGDLTVNETSAAGPGDDSDGEDIVIVIISGSNVMSRTGSTVATVSDDVIVASSGSRCTKQTSGSFTELRDDSGTVLYSTAGPWVFSGAPDIEGLSDDEQYAVLSDALVMSFDEGVIVGGLPSEDEVRAQATEELHYAAPMRKLAITAMLDGECGGSAL